jgi:threonine synthase
LRLLHELREADGDMIAVSDEEIAEAQTLLSTDAGVVAEFTSAATLAGLIRKKAMGSLDGTSAILVITGGRLD